MRVEVSLPQKGELGQGDRNGKGAILVCMNKIYYMHV
jgi:hypothetical protein